MLLRRITEHVKAQNWTAVALDFVIVVTGVFMGIQVASLNEARHENTLASSYLERIRNDLQDDIGKYESRFAFWGQVTDYGAEALSFAETGEWDGETSWRLVMAFYQASQVWFFIPSDRTYRELYSVGALHLIDNLQVRDALAEYYAAGDERNQLMFNVLPDYRERIRGITPFNIQQYIWSECHEDGPSPETGGIYQKLLDCDSPISEAEAELIVQTIMDEPGLINDLRFWITNLTVARKAASLARQTAIDTEALLSAELNDSL